VIEKLAVRPDIQGAEQNISQVEWAETAIEVAHVPENKGGLDPFAPGFVASEFEHGGAEIEPAIGIAPPVPFLEIRCRARPQLEDPVNSRLREFVYRGLEEVEFSNKIVGG
jgi:hypothetical protein